MNRIAVSLCALGILTGVTGCKYEPPAYTICLLDISKSITPEGRDYEFKVTDNLVDGMRRGDRLTIIPIMGDAMSDTPGHIVRLEAPVRREPYDHDLLLFREQAHGQLHAMRESAMAHPAVRTDILGTLDVAKQEFEADSGARSKRFLHIFSDFIEDDGAYHFSRDAALTSDAKAWNLAKSLRKERDFTLGGVYSRLDNLPSIDFPNLPPQRQQAVRAFWKEYLRSINPSVVAEAQISGKPPR